MSLRFDRCAAVILKWATVALLCPLSQLFVIASALPEVPMNLHFVLNGEITKVRFEGTRVVLFICI